MSFIYSNGNSKTYLQSINIYPICQPANDNNEYIIVEVPDIYNIIDMKKSFEECLKAMTRAEVCSNKNRVCVCIIRDFFIIGNERI